MALAACCCFSSSNAETITVIEEVTEIVQEEVTTTITEQVPIETTVTEQATVTPGNWSISGGAQILPDGTIVFDYRGGTATSTVDLSQYQVVNSITHQFIATGCNNMIGGAGCGDPNGRLDQLTVTFTYGNQTWSNTLQPNNLDGWSNYSFTYNVNQGNWSPDATLQFYGIDTGFWAGWYGPATQPGTLDVSYDVTTIVMEEITRQVTEIVEREITRQITRTYEVPDPVQMEIPSIDVPVVQTTEVASVTAAPEIAPVQVEVTNAQQEVVATIEIDVAPVVAEIQEQSGNQEVSKEEVQAKVEEAMANKQSSGGRLSVQVSNPFDPVQAAVAIAIMNQGEASSGFNQYQAGTLPDAGQFYPVVGLDGGINYDNPAQRLFTGASEGRWDEMVDSQWQR